MQTSFLPEIDDLIEKPKELKNPCPICKIREIHSIKRKVKDGYTIQNPDGSYYFKQIGVKEVLEEYWTCKKCTKILSAQDYSQFLINNFEEIFEEENPFLDELGEMDNHLRSI